MAEFMSTRNIAAVRKAHQCQCCGKRLTIGEPAFYFSGKFDGDFWHGHYHVECRAAEVAYNDMKDQWGDEYTTLDYIRDEPDDVDWLIAEHPLVADRLGFEAKL